MIWSGRLKAAETALLTALLVWSSGSVQAANPLLMPGTLSGPLAGQSVATPLPPQGVVPSRPLRNGSVVSGWTATQSLRATELQGLRIGQGSQRLSRQPLVSQAQQLAARTLASASQTPLKLHFNPDSGTPTFIKGRVAPPAELSKSLVAGIDFGAVAQRFLTDNRALLKLDNPGAELLLKQAVSDRSGGRHLRYQQYHQGVPLWGSELLVHLDQGATVYLANGHYQPSLRGVATTPILTAADAKARVLAELQLDAAWKIGSELMIYADQVLPRLTYKVDINPTISDRWIYFIDAQNGEVVHKLHNIHAAGSVVSSSADDLFGVNRSFNSWLQNGTYVLVDPSIPLNDVTASYDPVNNGPNPTGDTFILTANNGDGSQMSFVTSSSASVGWDPTAVSAMYNTRQVYDYYLNTFQRQSIDGNNKNLMVVVHLDQGLDNAFWNGTFMVYGDGGQLFEPLAKCLDVAAHEMTHGVIESSANLKYENQSGALNESFADLFGAMVDSGDWTMGEDCTRQSPFYLRNMQDPSLGFDPQPTKMSEYQNLPNTPSGDNGGVHINSGIPNRAAYLTANVIGRDKTQAIYYRALTIYLTASAQFIDARRALIQAAEDLYGAGSTEANAVAAAWDTVEVFDGGGAGTVTPTTSSPTPTDSVVGSDLALYLYPNGNQYFLFAQDVSNFAGYDKALDWSISTLPAFYSRPAAYTDNTGTYAYFIGADNNIYESLIATGIAPDTNVTQVTSTGDYWSFAISPDGHYLAYVTTLAADNAVHVLDLAARTQADYPILMPSYQQGSATSVGLIHYADSLSFDYTGSVLVFDMLACVSLPSSACVQGQPVNSVTGAANGQNYWSIGFLDLSVSTSTSPSFSFPFPAQNPLIDIGYPLFAANNNYVITLDYIETLSTGEQHSQVVTLDFEKQDSSLVYDYGVSRGPIWGAPSFWGDDDFITAHLPVTGATTTMRVPLLGSGSATPWQGDPAGAVQLNFAAVMPLMHRAGVRQLSGDLVPSQTSLDFGDVAVGSSGALTLNLSNNGNRDVEITDITLSGSGFSHNATNALLARGATLPITVRFTPSAQGAQLETLTFTSNGTPSSLPITLNGNGVLAGAGSDTQPPTVPQGLVASNITETSVTLSWQPSSDNVGVSGYELSRNGQLLATVNSTALIDSSLLAGGRYAYSVVAVDAAGNRSPQATVLVTANGSGGVNDIQSPSTPTQLSSTQIGDTSVTIVWSGASDDVGVSGYQVWRDGVLIAIVAAGSYTDTALQPATSYHYAIKALDAAGNSSAEIAISVMTASGMNSSGDGGGGVLGIPELLLGLLALIWLRPRCYDAR